MSPSTPAATEPAAELERLAGPNIVQVGLRGYATVEQYEVGQQLGVRRISARPKRYSR